MPHTTPFAEQEEYRIALVSPSLRMILAQLDRGSPCLPHISISKRARPAEQITDAIRRNWNVVSIVLDSLSIRGQVPACVVAELLNSDLVPAPQNLIPISIDEFKTAELNDVERKTIRNILMGSNEDRGPFSRLGWVDEAKRWIQESVSRHTVEFSDEIHQFNATDTFALVRFGTRQDPAYWLKATGSPNELEFTITAKLAKLFPQHLPPVVCARADWNAWVTEEAGRPISNFLTLAALESAVVALADLQINSTGHVPDLLSAGCADQRIPVLNAHIGEVFAFLEEAMAWQTSTKAPRLGSQRLREIECILEATCACMQELQIPDTLIHNDINPGNILFDDSRCVFTDWAEACIGNPFLTFQQLHDQADRNELTHQWCTCLKTLYKQKWSSILTERIVERALALSPLLAIASYLYGRGSWLTSSRRQDPQFQGFARSLARYMDRAVQAPELQEAICRQI